MARVKQINFDGSLSQVEQTEPTVGQIVHYVGEGGTHLYAGIIAVWDDGTVELQVTDRSREGGIFHATPIDYDGEKSTGTWHYRESEDAPINQTTTVKQSEGISEDKA